jgi:hypothetical protein
VDSVLPADWRRPVRRARTCTVQGRGASGRRGSQRTSIVTSAPRRMANRTRRSSENRSSRPRRRSDTRGWSVRMRSAAISPVQPWSCSTTASATCCFSAGMGSGRGRGCTTDNAAAAVSPRHREHAPRCKPMPARVRGTRLGSAAVAHDERLPSWRRGRVERNRGSRSRAIVAILAIRPRCNALMVSIDG